MSAPLPKQFAHLETLREQWDLPTERERHLTRVTNPLEDSIKIYDALLPLIEPIVEHLADFDIDALPPPQQSLLNLSLSFMEVSMAVEILKATTVPGGFAHQRFEVVF